MKNILVFKNKQSLRLYHVNVCTSLFLPTFEYMPLSEETEVQIYRTTNHTVISNRVVALQHTIAQQKAVTTL